MRSSVLHGAVLDPLIVLYLMLLEGGSSIVTIIFMQAICRSVIIASYCGLFRAGQLNCGFCLRGYIHLCSRKKGHFNDFFLENQHNFFLKLNVYLFLQVIRSFMNFFKRKYL